MINHDYPHRTPEIAMPVYTNTMHDKIKHMKKIHMITQDEFVTLLDESLSNKALRKRLLLTMRDEYKISETEYRQMLTCS